MIAEALGKFEWEVLQLPPDEFARWIAYFRIAQERAKNPPPGSPGSRANRGASASKKRLRAASGVTRSRGRRR